MKKFMCIIVVMLLMGVQETHAARGGGGRGGGGHGHGVSKGHGVPRGHVVSRGHGAHVYRGHRSSTRIWIAPSWGLWPSYYSPYYSAAYYTPPPTVVTAVPETYIQRTDQAESDNYWYFCPGANGYYPHVRECSEGWLKVIPTPADLPPAQN